MQRRWSLLAIWLFGSVLAALACSLNWASATIDGHYIPFGNDSFYHARRILDTAADPSNFYQFDQHIHAPEGSLLVWPWGYDYAMGWIVRLAVNAGISSEPINVLVWLPVVAVAATIALIILVGRGLGLSNWSITLAALCMALAPTTQQLHGTGQIDHHFAELIFLLAALASGLAWLHRPGRISRTVILAAALGVAPAIHNGLFILPLPLLATAFAFWLQGRNLPVKTVAAFAGVLLVTTFAILLPSLPFRLGRFEFFTLSWFHLYTAACTAAALGLMASLRPTRGGITVVVMIGVALTLPVISEIRLAQSFLGGTIEYLNGIGEMQSPLTLMANQGGDTLTRYYSYLIWVAPITGAICVVQCWRERTSVRLLFWITAVMGLILLSLQLRLHYFGGFALYLPWLVLLNDFLLKRPEIYKKGLLIASLLLLLLYAPALRYQLGAPMPRANDMSFENIYPLFEVLHDACEKDPGIVLIDNDAGHYVRYLTSCSVIANNFLLTPQQIKKVDEIQHLYSLSPEELQQQAPLIKYVVVRPFRIGPGPDGKFRYTFFTGTTRLANALLLQSAASLPPDYVLLKEIRFKELGNAPYAKLYQIERPAAGMPIATSAIDVIK